MIVKAALLLFRGSGNKKELLFVKAYNQSFFVFPGGKQEQGETIEAALSRELHEELQVRAENVQKLGIVSGSTPDGRPLQMHLYAANLVGNPQPSAEIQEIAWMTQEAILRSKEYMTPMTLEHVLPFLAKQKLW